MSQQISIPQKIVEKLKADASELGIEYSTLEKETIDLYNTEYMRNDKSFPSEEAKFDFCSQSVKGRHDGRKPFKPNDIVSLGIGRIKNKKDGGKWSEAYVMVQDKEKGKAVMKTLSFYDNDASRINNVQTLCLYQGVKLGVNNKTGDFSGDERTIFENPVKIEVPPMAILDQLGINRCTIATSINNLSKVLPTKYADDKDWKVIRGIIVAHRKGVNKDGAEWGTYTISDNSFEDIKDDQVLNADGSLIAKRLFTVWVNPIWVVYEKGNEMEFAGPISVYEKTKEVSMTAYLLVPVHMPYGKIEEGSKP